MAANVDVTSEIDNLERVLADPGSAESRADALAILRRWQWDRDLDDQSRTRARQLVQHSLRLT